MARRVVGLLVVLAIAWGSLALAIAFDWTPKLGLDLQGGTAVVLTTQEETDPESLEVAVDIMRRRIADEGVQEPDIQISGEDTLPLWVTHHGGILSTAGEHRQFRNEEISLRRGSAGTGSRTSRRSSKPTRSTAP